MGNIFYLSGLEYNNNNIYIYIFISCIYIYTHILDFIGKLVVPLGWYPSCLTPQGALIGVIKLHFRRMMQYNLMTPVRGPGSGDGETPSRSSMSVGVIAITSQRWATGTRCGGGNANRGRRRRQCRPTDHPATDRVL